MRRGKHWTWNWLCKVAWTILLKLLAKLWGVPWLLLNCHSKWSFQKYIWRKELGKKNHYCLSLTELIFCSQLTTLMFYSGTTVFNYEHSVKCLNFLHYFHEFNSNTFNKLVFKCSMLLLTKTYFIIRDGNEIWPWVCFPKTSLKMS